MFLLGMHRSGTSLITNLIASMGAYIGMPSELLEASPDNPRGFFERKDVVNINRAIMQLHGCNWFSVANFQSTRDVPLPEKIHFHMNHLINHLELNQPWIIKDPRLCLTLPYWLEFSPKPACIIASRNPASVAESLVLRNNMTPEYALALWEFHAVHLLNNTRHLPCIFVNYDALLAAPKRECDRLHKQLAAYVPSLAAPDVTLVEPSLQRAQTDKKLSPTHTQLYHQLQGTRANDVRLEVSAWATKILQEQPAHF